jgi:hypothetical protein
MSDWTEFARHAAELMRRAKANEVKLRVLADFLDETPVITNADLRRIVVAMVCEIDGSPAYYDELMRAFETSACEADLIAYVES